MIELKKQYVAVASGQLLNDSSFGGSQMWFQERSINRCGCGVVAAYDLILYITSGYDCRNQNGISRNDYTAELKRIQKKYFPLLYPFGLTGIQLAVGMNRLFLDMALPYRASWSMTGKNLTSRIKDMLMDDIPVILSIGPNFPFFWEKHTLSLYRRERGVYRKASEVKGHYITVVGIDDVWMKISSWGRLYYIKLDEYQDYIARYSSSITSNLLRIKKK